MAIYPVGNYKVDEIKSDFDIVFKALVDTKFDVLNGRTLREMIPFTGEDYATIMAAMDFLTTGQKKPTRFGQGMLSVLLDSLIDKIVANRDQNTIL